MPQAVEKVAVGLGVVRKQTQTPPKQAQNHHKLGSSASEEESEKGTEEFFNRLARFWYPSIEL